MIIGVTSKNNLKISVVREVYGRQGIFPVVLGFSTPSGVGEQPVNEQTLLGARNRLEFLLAKPESENLGRIVSIENGIFFENGEWLDKGVVIFYDVSRRLEHVAYSDPVIFPKEYVELTAKRGFERNTVGEIMKEKGFVSDARDPHLSISGISRKNYLFKTLDYLVRNFEPELFKKS